MPAGRPCIICSNSKKARRCAEMIALGATDGAIAAEMGVHRLSVLRHRQRHVVAPARAILEAGNKGRDAQLDRQRIMTAANTGDLNPTDYLSLASIVGDLRRTGERLERVADAAENGGSHLAVASLSSQQLRAAEVRGKLGGVGAYAPRHDRGGGEVHPFVLTINLGEGKTQRIEAIPAEVPDMAPAPPTLDLSAFTTVGSGFALPAMEPLAGDADAEFEEDV